MRKVKLDREKAKRETINNFALSVAALCDFHKLSAAPSTELKCVSKKNMIPGC